MEYFIVVYRSRSDSTKAYNYLTEKGENAQLVSTPRSVNVGCGLSVKCSYNTIVSNRSVLSGGSIVGFYKVMVYGGRTTTYRI